MVAVPRFCVRCGTPRKAFAIHADGQARAAARSLDGVRGRRVARFLKKEPVRRADRRDVGEVRVVVVLVRVS